MRKQIAGAASIAVLALPAAAGAHVTMQPGSAAAGKFTVENVRVPNESDSASTTKVDLKLPDGFAFASYEKVPGWTAKVARAKLAEPIKADDGEIDEQVSRIVWTANSDTAGIQPGQFQDFPLSVQIPGKEGDTLTFKAIQTYSDGEVARWIGAPDAEKPAPQIAVTAAAAEHGAAASEMSDEDDGDTLAVIALIVGALGLGAGATALVLGRKK